MGYENVHETYRKIAGFGEEEFQKTPEYRIAKAIKEPTDKMFYTLLDWDSTDHDVAEVPGYLAASTWYVLGASPLRSGMEVVEKILEEPEKVPEQED